MLSGDFHHLIPVYATDFFLYTLKTLENLWFSFVLSEYIKRPVK